MARRLVIEGANVKGIVTERKCFNRDELDIINGFNITIIYKSEVIDIEGDVYKRQGLDGEAIQDIKYLKDSILISGIERDGEIHIPSGDFVLHKNDKLYVIGEHKKIEVFFKRLGKFQDRIKNPLIIGGGRITHYLVNIIDSLRVTSKIIELDLDKCIELNETLPEAIVINGDGTDHELLLSENLQEADAFIALTGRDEENVLTSLFAINNNVKNVITKVTRLSLIHI